MQFFLLFFDGNSPYTTVYGVFWHVTGLCASTPQCTTLSLGLCLRQASNFWHPVDAPQAWQHAWICAEGRLRAQSPTQRSASPTGRWHGNARGSAPPQPHNPSNSQHTATAHPRRLLGLAPNSVEISSIGGMTGPQQIGALWSLDPQQSLKTFISRFKAPTARVGNSASNKQLPQFSLVQASLPCKLERRPMSRAASPGPRAKHRDRATTADRLIGVPWNLVGLEFRVVSTHGPSR